MTVYDYRTRPFLSLPAPQSVLMTETITFTIEGSDGSSDDVVLPSGLLDLLADQEDSPAGVIGDLAMVSCAQRIHAAIHHGHDEPDAELQSIEDETMALFEERFGASFAELTGHSH